MHQADCGISLNRSLQDGLYSPVRPTIIPEKTTRHSLKSSSDPQNQNASVTASRGTKSERTVIPGLNCENQSHDTPVLRTHPYIPRLTGTR